MFGKILRAVGITKKQSSLPPEDRPQPTESAAPVDVTDADFDVRVLQSEGLVVVDFWAEWCQPCQVMSAYVEFLARDYPGRLTVAALDVDENPKTAEQFAVMGLPTLLFFQNGEVVERITGVVEYSYLKRTVERLLRETTADHESYPSKGVDEVHDEDEGKE